MKKFKVKHIMVIILSKENIGTSKFVIDSFVDKFT